MSELQKIIEDEALQIDCETTKIYVDLLEPVKIEKGLLEG